MCLSVDLNFSNCFQQTKEMFEMEMMKENVTISKYAPQTYDAIWAMALTMRNSLSCKAIGFLKSFSYGNVKMVDRFVSEMDSLTFVGISVSIP